MHRVLFALAILLVSSRAEAVPFTPTEWSFTITGATFDETGTNTICWRCSDADPNNDVHALISAGGIGGGFWTPLTSFAAGGVSVDFTGSTATDVTGFDFPFAVHIVVTMTNGLFAAIESGDLLGQVLAIDGENLVMPMCCGGDFSGVSFGQAGIAFPFPFAQGFGFRGIEVHTFGGQVMSNTPEPASLFLLGSSLAAAAVQRRRRRKGRNRVVG